MNRPDTVTRLFDDARGGTLIRYCPRSPIIIAVVVIPIIVYGPQEMLEGPLGHTLALAPRFSVGEVKMYTLVNSGLDNILCRIREMAINPRLLNRCWIGGGHGESNSIATKEAPKDARYGACHVVRA